MAPRLGSVHTRARSDSGAAVMWEWACRRQLPWSTLDLLEACGGSPRRIRAIVAAWHDAGLLRRIKPVARVGSRGVGKGPRPATYEVPEIHRDTPAPVMIVERGVIVGARISSPIHPA